MIRLDALIASSTIYLLSYYGLLSYWRDGKVSRIFAYSFPILLIILADVIQIVCTKDILVVLEMRQLAFE